MKYILKIFFCLNLFLFYSQYLNAENIYFIDFGKILNSSQAGADAQKKLKEKFKTESDRFIKEEESIKKEESDLISQKKVLSKEEYQTKIDSLRKRVSELQQNQQTSLNNIAKARVEARQVLIKTVNPIIKKYMEENNIKIVFDKESVILGDTNLEITNQIIEILNKEIKSIKIN